jgi:hypothetical protein
MAWKGGGITASEELEPVGRIQIPKTFTLQLLDDHLGRPDVEVTWQVRGGKPQCTAVTVTATEQEVQSSWLCGIRLDDLLDHVIQRMRSGLDDPDTDWFDFPRLAEAAAAGRSAAAQVRIARKTKITDELLREAAEIYRAAGTDKPTMAVAEHFGRQHRTAAVYVKKARERGYLGAAAVGKAGEQS